MMEQREFHPELIDNVRLYPVTGIHIAFNSQPRENTSANGNPNRIRHLYKTVGFISTVTGAVLVTGSDRIILNAILVGVYAGLGAAIDITIDRLERGGQ